MLQIPRFQCNSKYASSYCLSQQQCNKIDRFDNDLWDFVRTTITVTIVLYPNLEYKSGVGQYCCTTQSLNDLRNYQTQAFECQNHNVQNRSFVVCIYSRYYFEFFVRMTLHLLNCITQSNFYAAPFCFIPDPTNCNFRASKFANQFILCSSEAFFGQII